MALIETPVALVWHRRDLRVADHPALTAAIDWAQQHHGSVIGIFIFDVGILESGQTGSAQVAFMLGCLAQLQQSYRALGSELYFLRGEPVSCLTEFIAQVNANAVFFGEDVEPMALERDRLAKQSLANLGIAVFSYLDIDLVAPDQIWTKTGEPYKVYTPFWRNWSQHPKPLPYAKPDRLPMAIPDLVLNLNQSLNQSITRANLGVTNLPDAASIRNDWGFNCDFRWEYDLPEFGEAAALGLLTEFCDQKMSQKLFQYHTGRDFPAITGTSQLSPHLRFGTVGIRQVWAATVTAEAFVRSDEELTSLTTWRQELAWREFYHHVLYHFPQLANGPYRSQMAAFPWENDPDKFMAWQEGRTGFPIVDAAMRQLNQTGWMHNRCRMIVASFLTKDLLINWQWGEQYFMERLIDGELAANNGGWQWSASSGMDPKPLRIFNPASQAKKYDPEGAYIRQWIPELRGLTTAEILSGDIPPHQCQRQNYPLPIVDHKVQQQRFKSLYQQLK
jgi:deoxyribodipyrimidine photo-lyase